MGLGCRFRARLDVFHWGINWKNGREVQWWFISYVCLLTLYWGIVTNELQYSCLSHFFIFFKIADIRALCMFLNLAKYCSHWKEISLKKVLYKVYWRLFFYMLVVSHFSSNSWSSFSYSYVALGVLCQFLKKKLSLHNKICSSS